MTEPWPTELKLDKGRRVLTVTYDDGVSFALPAEFLRVLSPSAEVQGHSPEQRVTVAGKKSVGIARLEPV
ncbi:MAG TPA: gamma-butyrobetaine hydroxylase-like domain-containing protein, partial [Methyloceanibacter sp.]|nr:gamma-butyrobetaine hydroxylase-like domain-containing protein [Methyloceanibacter sp.]